MKTTKFVEEFRDDQNAMTRNSEHGQNEGSDFPNQSIKTVIRRNTDRCIVVVHDEKHSCAVTTFLLWSQFNIDPSILYLSIPRNTLILLNQNGYDLIPPSSAKRRFSFFVNRQTSIKRQITLKPRLFLSQSMKHEISIKINLLIHSFQVLHFTAVPIIDGNEMHRQDIFH